jgi:uncharacterized surface protein with fasciclin (FAS1) repeats
MFRIRFLPVALAVLLLAAACGEDTSEEVVDTTTATTRATPAAGDLEATEAQVDEEPEPFGTIVEVAVQSGAFPTLIAAVEAAGLVDTLNSDGPFTVFAPTEDAFAAALDTLGVSVEELLSNTELLAAVLTYHVLAGEVPSDVVTTLDGDSIATVNGADITITIDGNTVQVNDATVITTDIQATNGIIHIIDTVLLPPSDG